MMMVITVGINLNSNVHLANEYAEEVVMDTDTVYEVVDLGSISSSEEAGMAMQKDSSEERVSVKDMILAQRMADAE